MEKAFRNIAKEANDIGRKMGKKVSHAAAGSKVLACKTEEGEQGTDTQTHIDNITAGHFLDSVRSEGKIKLEFSSEKEEEEAKNEAEG